VACSWAEAAISVDQGVDLGDLADDAAQGLAGLADQLTPASTWRLESRSGS
jgi:hypothetical protein